ncbi:cobalt ECF transporter T component CbiQ [Clostridium sp. D2Q-11]|uniref:Cobalt ECF transporter T component CbiQ n=2 Tax=Anaeromonas frigoriresistens TaxID=2683708 RepID=A0A942UZR6_9FIRM|nr:cobalt ECF transporter T component CbiQ [Anaeromonas frigoriresistens]
MISIALFANNSFIHLAIFSVMSIIVTIIAKIPIKVYFKMYLLPIAFILLSLIAFIFSISNNDITSLFSIKISSFFIIIREDSLIQAISLITRAFSTISCSYFLILTTPFNSLIKLLLKYKVPVLLIELTMLTYRFIFILLEEISKIYRAQDLKFGYNTMKNSFNSLGLLLRTLIVRMIKRYKDMIVSLESKNYDSQFYM